MDVKEEKAHSFFVAVEVLVVKHRLAGEVTHLIWIAFCWGKEGNHVMPQLILKAVN